MPFFKLKMFDTILEIPSKHIHTHVHTCTNTWVHVHTRRTCTFVQNKQSMIAPCCKLKKSASSDRQKKKQQQQNNSEISRCVDTFFFQLIIGLSFRRTNCRKKFTRPRWIRIIYVKWEMKVTIAMHGNDFGFCLCASPSWELINYEQTCC